MEKPSVIITPYPRTIAEIFDEHTWAKLLEVSDVVWGRDDPMPEAELATALVDATAVAFGEWRYPSELIRNAGPKLRCVFEVMGTHDHPQLDYDACFARDVLVGSIAPAFGPVVAEMCLALALAASRGVAISDRRFRTGTEEYLHAGNAGSTSLLGKTVGFVGCGAISRSLQALLEPFGVRIIGYDPWLDDTALGARRIERAELPDLFDRADIVFVLAVPTPANEGMISAELMYRLQPQNTLVVASRARLVDFDALTSQVLAGRFRAGIDVYPREPLPADHPIRGADGAVLTAHLAGALPEALHQIGRMIVTDLEKILAGGDPGLMQYATPGMVTSLRRDKAAAPRTREDGRDTRT